MRAIASLKVEIAIRDEVNFSAAANVEATASIDNILSAYWAERSLN